MKSTGSLLLRSAVTVAVASAAFSFLSASAQARPASILELDRGGVGLGLLTDTGSTGGSLMGAVLLSDGNTIAQATSLTGDLSAYDAVWVSYNTDSPLTAGEVSNLQAFLAAGKKVVLIGDKNGTDYATYDASLLSVVGGGYGGSMTGAHNVAGNSMASDWDQQLTDGLTSVRFAGVALLTGAGSPELLFNDGSGSDSAIAGLFHSGGGGEALAILDASWMTNNANYGLYGSLTAGQNDDFAHNISAWLDPPEAAAAPEPATIGVVGFGLVALAAFGRLRRKRRG